MTGQGGQTRAPTPLAAGRWWLVLPAAGFGRRMRSDTPKQYMKIGGRSILDITLGRFAGLPGLAGVVLVAAGDIPADAVNAAGSQGVPLLQVSGGATRAESVRNGLAAFRDRWAELAPDEPADAGLGEWAMIHDAARPCVRPEDIRALLAAARAPDGALLGARVRDTIKRVDHRGRVEATVDRRPLMHALTPQMFPVGVLLSALEQGLEAGREITDESSAVEQVGLSPRIVPAAADNLKITHPEDLAIARAILARQGVLNG
ncbi:2-C-methyl-D-erythritol 4-phosphate cytidylyltransferase [Guyparkeria sp. 1SP6A2]|nr:2-C-methyl-D-erythritol 4-phosphate cytidylyltransferase [Guyparkeria sp. 1SP6A2]